MDQAQKESYFENAIRQGDATGFEDLGGGPMPYFIDPRTGDKRILNFYPTRPDHPMMKFQNPTAVIPPSEFAEFDAPTSVPIRDQNGRGACVAFATTRCAMKLAAMMGIADMPQLSEWFLYTLIDGGVDGGASIGDAAQVSMTTGWCPDSMVPNLTIRPKGYSKAAVAGAIYKIAKVTNIPGGDADAIRSAVAARKMVVLDVRAGNWFDTDSDGTVAYGRGMTNHAICVGGGMRKVGSIWQPEMDNSWSPSWGVKGRGWLTDNHLRSTSDVWVYEGLILIPGTMILPPVAP